MRRSGIEWDGSFGRKVEYRGPHLNLNHDFDYRRRQHVPLFTRTLAEHDADLLLEWWLTRGPLREPKVESGASTPRGFKTIVHYRKDDGFLRGLLTYFQASHNENRIKDGRLPSLSLLGDLPHSPIAHEAVIETIIPEDPAYGTWGLAMTEATEVPRRMMRVEDAFHG